MYTVVSRGRVLGTTEFEYTCCMDRSRAGSFWPAAGFEHLLEIAVGVSPAMIRADKTGRADLASAVDRFEALDLELRGADGSLIETEHIGIQDTELLLSLAEASVERELYDEFADEDIDFCATDCDEFEDELFAESEPWREELDPEWADEPERSFPRYQIFVSLAEGADVP